ncbi:MFS substrate transporter [Salix suchowensis]|nr:MFS substrate transporter [Salix suchowensis]
MSDPPKLDGVVFDALMIPELPTSSSRGSDIPSEREPLLGAPPPRRKPFYRARPLCWPARPCTRTLPTLRSMPRGRSFAWDRSSQTLVYDRPAEPYLPNAELNSLNFISNITDDDDQDPMSVPSERCMSDSDVQAGAARIQTVMTIIMGSLSALTTGWWGHFGERYGRCRVLALTTLGVLMTDLTFILVSTPSSPLAAHGHKLLILAPIIEGSLGGWSALQAGISAYISDCTSAGSRAHIFSRFTGVFYLGFSVGPSIGGWLIRHSNSFKFFDYLGAMHPGPTRQSVTPVFWVSALASLANLVLIFFVIPESLSKEKQAAARFEYNGEGKGKGRALVTADTVSDESSSGATLWAARQAVTRTSSCGCYSHFVYSSPTRYKAEATGSLSVHSNPNQAPRKPNPHPPHRPRTSATSLATTSDIRTSRPSNETNPEKHAIQIQVGEAEADQGAPCARDALRHELCRASLMLDITSNVLVVLSPSPAYKVHASPSNSGSPVEAHSQALFVMASSLTSFGCGFMPAVQSLALCILQARALYSEENATPRRMGRRRRHPGQRLLLASCSVRSRVAGGRQMILGGTVATFPKAVFNTAAGILILAILAIFLVQPPLGASKGKKTRRDSAEIEVERGRSRVPKDLRMALSLSAAGRRSGRRRRRSAPCFAKRVLLVVCKISIACRHRRASTLDTPFRLAARSEVQFNSWVLLDSSKPV